MLAGYEAEQGGKLEVAEAVYLFEELSLVFIVDIGHGYCIDVDLDSLSLGAWCPCAEAAPICRLA